MNLLDPDFGDRPAPDLLNRLESITEPLLLSLAVIEPDLQLTSWLSGLLDVHLLLGPHEKWLNRSLNNAGMPSLGRLPRTRRKLKVSRYESSGRMVRRSMAFRWS